MGRFLIRFSYFGTQYSGLQRQPQRLKIDGTPVNTIEGALGNALKNLLPANDFKITLSSRTDKGVHSLRNACHVDLQHPEDGKEFMPEVITNLTNFHLKAKRHDIRVLETCRVSDSFHARFLAIERRYVYRIAHTTGPAPSEKEAEDLLRELGKYWHGHHKHPRYPFGENLVIPDAYRLRAFRQTLDIDKLMSAACLLSGIHNYTAFSKRIDYNNGYRPNPVKLLTIGIKRGQPMGHSLYGHDNYLPRNLELWDIHVRAKSFLYRQIRRLVGAMVLVAKGTISLEELKDVLDNPRTQFPFSGRLGMDEFGLFLADVVYNPDDLLEPDSSALSKAVEESGTWNPLDKEK